MRRKWPWQRSAGWRCGGGCEPELAIRCRRSVSRGDPIPDCDRELRAGCCRKRLQRSASCWREDSGEEPKRLGIRGNPEPSSFGSCGVDESAVDLGPRGCRRAKSVPTSRKHSVRPASIPARSSRARSPPICRCGADQIRADHQPQNGEGTRP